jgi:uncharacterized protein YhhL (DUF1145 family)
MKHIEISKQLHLGEETPDGILKHAFLQRLQRSFKIDLLQEHATGFHIVSTTGGSRSMVRNVRVNLDVNFINKGNKVGVLVHGYSRVAQSLMIVYTVLFLMIMVVGLLPGFVETDDSSTAADALVFLIFGIFIFYDIDKKLQEPKENIEAALDSLNVEFA